MPGQARIRVDSHAMRKIAVAFQFLTVDEFNQLTREEQFGYLALAKQELVRLTSSFDAQHDLLNVGEAKHH
jgi:hypothetical protein